MDTGKHNRAVWAQDPPEDNCQGFGFFLPSTCFANLQPLLQLWRKGKGTNAACEAEYVFSMTAKMLLIQRHACPKQSFTLEKILLKAETQNIKRADEYTNCCII